MNEVIETKLFLIPEEAHKFLLFQKYYEPISKMIDAGVFEQRNVTLNMYFDHDGVLQTIGRSDVLYKRMAKKD